jgi:hypothetical protein
LAAVTLVALRTTMASAFGEICGQLSGVGPVASVDLLSLSAADGQRA